MPEIDLSLPLFSADAGVACDWANAHAGAGSVLSFSAAFRRGINLNVGAAVFADIDAAVQYFIAARLTGEAHARANITAQLQTPLNLFDEVGVAIRLEAVAEAAAGASLTIGLSVGELLDLVANDPKMKGVAEKLLIVFLEEVNIQVGAYAKAAAAAMAYADLVIAGSLVPNSVRGTTPGFTITVEAGAGLEAGAGVRVCAAAGINNPRRLVLRSIDIAVDELVNEIAELLPNDDNTSQETLNAFRAPSKTAFRIAYEIGHLVTDQIITHSAESAEKVAMRCVQVVLEESQRYILDRLVNTGLRMFKDFLDSVCMGVEDDIWNSLEGKRDALADKLSEMSHNPFFPDNENRQYWMDLVLRVVELVLAVPDLSDDDSELQSVSMLWAAVQLLFKGMERATEATVAAQVVGLEPQHRHAAFAEDSITQPHDRIKSYLNAQLGRDSDEDLTLAHLTTYLVTEPVAEILTSYFPDVKRYFDIFRNSPVFGNSNTQIAALLMNNLGGFITDDHDNVDNKASLRAVLTCLKDFLTDTVNSELVPIVDEHIGNREDLHVYLHEVVIASLQITTDIVFEKILDWENGDGLTQTALKDTLSSVLMMLLGRSLVSITDVLSTHVRSKVQDEFNRMADDNGLIENMVQFLPQSQTSEELAEITKEMLRIGADVFGPLPEETRVKIRSLLYEILAPLPASDQEDFWTNLRRENSIPDLVALESVGWELAGIAAGNLYEFSTRVLQRLAELLLELLQTEIKKIVQRVEEWISYIEETLRNLRAYLDKLREDIEQLIAEVTRLFEQAANSVLGILAYLSHDSGRDEIRDQVIGYIIRNAEDALQNNSVYILLPADKKTEAKNMTRSIIRFAFDNDIADLIWDAIGSAASDLDIIVDDLREMNPHEDLADQLCELLLDRIEDNIETNFGSNPGIDIRFEIRWGRNVTYTDYTDLEYAWTHDGNFPTKTKYIGIKETINLGRIELPTSIMISSIRWVLSNVVVAKNMLIGLAGQLQEALSEELNLNKKEKKRTDKENEEVSVKKQIEESKLAARDVNIYEPAPGAAYNDNLHVDIELYGVPMSFLGLGEGEQQRVFVWINGHGYPMRKFVVDEVYWSLIGTLDSSILSSMYQSAASDVLSGSVSAEFGAKSKISKKIEAVVRSNIGLRSAQNKGTDNRARLGTAYLSSSVSTKVSRYLPGLKVGRWGNVLPIQDAHAMNMKAEPIETSSQQNLIEQTLLKKNGTNKYNQELFAGSELNPSLSGDEFIESTEKPSLKVHQAARSVLYRRAEQTCGRPVDQAERQRIKSESGRAILSGAGSVRADSGGISYTTTDGKTKMGKKPTASEKEAVSQTAPYPIPYLRLKLDVPIEKLEEGMNTLAVVIADGRDIPIQHAVTFIVSEPLEVEDGLSPYRLPIRPDVRPNHKEKPEKVIGKILMTPTNRLKERIHASRQEREASRTDPRKVIRLEGGRDA